MIIFSCLLYFFTLSHYRSTVTVLTNEVKMLVMTVAEMIQSRFSLNLVMLCWVKLGSIMLRSFGGNVCMDYVVYITTVLFWGKCNAVQAKITPRMYTIT